MNKITILTSVLIALSATFTTLPQEPKQLYEVRCPNCLFKGFVLAQQVLANGGSAWTNYYPMPMPTNAPPGFVPGSIAIPGSMQQLSASFHCRECHFDFMAPIKPDRFVPTMPAQAPARPPGVWPNPPGMSGMPELPELTPPANPVPGGNVSGPAYTVEPATAYDRNQPTPDYGPAKTNSVQVVERLLRVVPLGDGSEYAVYHFQQLNRHLTTNGLEELIRVIQLPNGSEFVLYRRPSTSPPAAMIKPSTSGTSQPRPQNQPK